MATTDWNDDWNDPSYVWPVTSVPDAAVVEQLGKTVVARGGRVIKEAHADRGVTMEFPNGAVPGTRIRKQVPRAECRRRALVAFPVEEKAPVKVCVVCDAVHLWPNASPAAA
jgi:hypothetical protein